MGEGGWPCSRPRPVQTWLYSACKLSRDFYGNYKVTVITGPPSGETLGRGILHFLQNTTTTAERSAESNDVMRRNGKTETFFNNSDSLTNYNSGINLTS